MNRLNVWVMLLVLLAAASCSGSSPVDGRADAGQSGANGPGRAGFAVTEAEIAQPRTGSVLSTEASALLKPGKAPAGLPQLPANFDLPPVRLPSTLEQSFRNGSDSFDASANATTDGTTKILDSTDGELAWAIYEVPLLSGSAQITKLYVTITNWVPSAEGEQGWIYGLANYNLGRWQSLGFTTVGATVREMHITAPYRGPGGNAYIFVATSNAQQITVGEVGFDLDVVGWDEVELDSASLPNWTQGIDFTLTDNPVIAYTKPTSGYPLFVVGDRSKDLLNAGNWILTNIDPALDPTLDASWIDVLVDEGTGYPRACYITEGHPAETGGTQLIFAAIFPFGDGATIWLPYELKRNDETYEDGAAWTHLARQPFFDNSFAFVTHVANDGFRDGIENSFDMQYRTFEIADPLSTGTAVFVDRTSGFGTDWLYPHLAFARGGADFGFAVNGGNNFGGQTLEGLAPILQDEDSTNFGSIATNPVEDTLGSTFVKTAAGEHQLMFTGYDDGLLGFPEEVTSAATGGGGWIGTSQLAYAPDGSPGIVFTESDGGAVFVKYAVLANDSWVVETVSDDASTPTGMDPLSVIVDLAYDSTGIPAVCYNHVAGESGGLRFAIRSQ